MSKRGIARHFGISRDSVDKMIVYSVPPGYRRTAPVKRPKLDGFTEIIDRWLCEDADRPRKQRHTAKRVLDRLRDEHGFTGGYTIVKAYVREHQRRGREMFVPLHHAPGHAQADFGEALVVIGGGRADGALLRLRPAAQRRLLYPGLPGGDGRGVGRRPRARLRLLRAGAAVGAL